MNTLFLGVGGEGVGGEGGGGTHHTWSCAPFQTAGAHCVGCHGYLEEGGESCSIESHSEVLQFSTDLTHYVGVETGNCFLCMNCECIDNIKIHHNTILISSSEGIEASTILSGPQEDGH